MASALLNYRLQVGNNEYILGGATAGSFDRNNGGYLSECASFYGARLQYRGGDKRGYALYQGKDQIAWFHLFGGNNQRSYFPVRGATAVHAWVDEATLCHESFITTVIERCTYDASTVVLTTNADTPLHYIKTAFIDEPSDKTYIMQSDFYENKYYSDIRRRDLLGLNPNSANYKRAILNEWTAAEGQIIPIVKEHIVEMDTPLAGDVYLDPGTASYTAALLFVPLADGRWLVADEYYWAGDKMGRLTDQQHINNIRNKWQVRNMVLDPAGSSMRASAFSEGFSPRYADNSFDKGVQITNNALYAGRLLIHKRCVNLQNEAGGYIWNPGSTAPIPQAKDHLMDCLRYGATKTFPNFTIRMLAK